MRPRDIAVNDLDVLQILVRRFVLDAAQQVLLHVYSVHAPATVQLLRELQRVMSGACAKIGDDHS